MSAGGQDQVSAGGQDQMSAGGQDQMQNAKSSKHSGTVSQNGLVTQQTLKCQSP
jgi:hypothetical protein